jgi:sucrose-6-phosphate hydrolase SacC (GH32 family)
VVLVAGENTLSGLEGELVDLEVEFEPSAGAQTIFDVRGIEVEYDSEAQTLSIGSESTKLEPVHGLIRLRILLDRASIEVYGNDGRLYIPRVVFLRDDNLFLKAIRRKGQVRANYLRVHELRSSWDRGLH